MSLWNLLTVALATSTVVIGHYAYTQTGPQGPKGPQGESFSIDLSQNLTDCADFKIVSDQYSFASPSQKLLWLVETDSRPDTVGCPTLYDLNENDVTADDLSGHVLVYDGETWLDHGTFNGIVGPDGSPGRSLLNGTSAPSNGTGNNGDYFIDTVTKTIYGPKASGTWPVGASLIGPDGADGADGADANGMLSGSGAPTNGQGADGDFYIRTNDTLYGPKAAGSWPAGTSLISSPALSPIAATVTTGDSYPASGGNVPLKFNAASITSGLWTQGGTGNITWTCATAGTYEIEALVDFKCTSFTSEFYPQMQLLYNGGVGLSTAKMKFRTSGSRTFGKLHHIRAFVATETLQLTIDPFGVAGTDTVQPVDSSFTIKRVV
jgi:hypothetical protein